MILIAKALDGIEGDRGTMTENRKLLVCLGVVKREALRLLQRLGFGYQLINVCDHNHAFSCKTISRCREKKWKKSIYQH